MKREQNSRFGKKLLLFSVLILFLLFSIQSIGQNSNIVIEEADSLIQNGPLTKSGDTPIVNNITANDQYFKNGDLIKLTLVCDQANYSISANFSSIDDQFLPGEEYFLDHKNGTYLINYTLSPSNTKPNGLYQITINSTNLATGFSTLNTTFLSLDNIIPNIYISTPRNGAFIRTSNVTIEGFMNATGSKINFLTINDTRFEFLTNMIGEAEGNFVIANKSAIKEGSVSLLIELRDSVNLINISVISFTLDNTKPTLTVNAILPITGNELMINLGLGGTFSPISDFQYNIPEFSIFVGGSPIGEISHSLILANIGTPLMDGKYTLNITLTDSVNLSYSHFIPLIIDVSPPNFEAIIQNITTPEYYQQVNISIINPYDNVSGINSTIFYYSIDNKTSWNSIDITEINWAVIPALPYQTLVYYQFKLKDNKNNENNSKIFNYTTTDKIIPILGEIFQNPVNPNQNTPVNITIPSAIDLGAGIAHIYLNYSINNGLNWALQDITLTRWGLIEKQPSDTMVLYQLIVVDRADNENKSQIMEYIVYFEFDYGNFFTFLVILGSVVGLSAYSAKVIYSRRKQKKLRLEYSTEKQKFNSYTDLRLEDLNFLLNDIEAVESDLNKILKFQWIAEDDPSKADNDYIYRMIKEFMGINQFSNELLAIEAGWNVKKQEFDDKFRVLKEDSGVSKREVRLVGRIDACAIALGKLNKTFREKFPLYIEGKQSQLKIEYPLGVFDQKLAKLINDFQSKYNKFTKEFEQLLIARQNKVIEGHLNELGSLFKETDEWLKNAEEWSKVLPLPNERGYKYLLKLKKDQYNSLKDDFSVKIEKYRAELSSSIAFAQDFIKWNYDSSTAKLRKFEKTINEDVVRFISAEDFDSANLNAFIEEKFNSFNTTFETDKRKVEEFYETHKEFHIQEVYEEWTAFMKDLPVALDKIKTNLNKYIQPVSRLFNLIKGIRMNFYNDTMSAIEKLSGATSESIKLEETVSPVDTVFSNVIWKINRIDNEIKKWIDHLPFDLETSQLMIVIRDWSETKEEIFEKLNKLGKEKRIYKCEIMHEVLDPLNAEIWECSNCGAIACLEHLEKWYHRKQAPECFKCGKAGTFKLKVFAERGGSTGSI
ncbi:MAG: hypothetical protein LUQ65_05055 [Candidatus Helarchaeota archaeon]|nr:hypothetical protein [Candidatus Helarchaeota archaeon]